MIKIMYVQDGGRQTKQMSDPLLQTYIKWLVSKTACPPHPKKKIWYLQNKKTEATNAIWIGVTCQSKRDFSFRIKTN